MRPEHCFSETSKMGYIRLVGTVGSRMRPCWFPISTNSAVARIEGVKRNGQLQMLAFELLGFGASACCIPELASHQPISLSGTALGYGGVEGEERIWEGKRYIFSATMLPLEQL